jgi:hypothetical protein
VEEEAYIRANAGRIEWQANATAEQLSAIEINAGCLLVWARPSKLMRGNRISMPFSNDTEIRSVAER